MSVAGMLLALAIALCFFLRTRTQGVDTSTEMRSLRFYRSGAEWFADVPQHTQAENQMVAGADTLLDEVSGGSDEVKVVISSDIANPSEWKLHSPGCATSRTPYSEGSIRRTSTSIPYRPSLHPSA